MCSANPVFDILTKANSQLQHLSSLLIRDAASDIVAAHVCDFFRKPSNVSMRFLARTTVNSKAGSHDDDDCLGTRVVLPRPAPPWRLERGVVCDSNAPISRQTLQLASLDIAIGKAQQVGDFFSARDVHDKPAILQPILQAHSAYRSETDSSLGAQSSRNDCPH